MSEAWKPVSRFEGLYEVSTLGRVRSLRGKDAPKILRAGESDGYPSYTMFDNGQSDAVGCIYLCLRRLLGRAQKGTRDAMLTAIERTTALATSHGERGSIMRPTSAGT